MQKMEKHNSTKIGDKPKFLQALKESTEYDSIQKGENQVDLSDIHSSQAPATTSEHSYDPHDEELREILVKVEEFVNNLEKSRIKTVSIFPYTIDENSEISILFRRKKIDTK